METEQKFVVALVNITSQSQKEKCEQLAHESEADGIEEFSLDEKAVDQILGVESFTASGSDSKSHQQVEDYIKNRDGQLLKIYFCKNNYSQRAKEFQEKLKKTLNLEAKGIEFDWEDWNSEWRKYYKKIKVSDELSIVPEWEKGNTSNNNEVYIYPGMGFGTGDHQTTYLCLVHFEQLRKNKGQDIKRILDFGCGSGILGIAALKKLENIYCEFCDIDTRALDNCVQNLTLNFTQRTLEGQKLVSRVRFKPEGQYDLIFANILEPVLIEEAQLLKNSLSSNGDLIISGLLKEQVENVSENYKDLILVDQIYKDDWASLHFKKP